MIGNFIADTVKKSEWPMYKTRVVHGIQLHHKIDFYTDNHPVVDRSKKRLRPNHSKYSPVVADIIYDHFLASQYQQIYNVELNDFASRVYKLLRKRWDELPKPIKHMVPYMEKGNWLVNYGNKEGLTRVFRGMSRRASFKNQMQDATKDLFHQYEAFQADFDAFYPDLQQYCAAEIGKMNLDEDLNF